MGLFLFNLGFLVGVVGSGWVADALQARGVPPVRSVAVMIALTVGIELLFAFEATSLAYVLCFTFGCFGSATTLIYAVYGQHFAPSMAGRVNTAQNLISFVAAFIAQWGIGEILARWPQIAPGRYDPAGHQVAMLAVIAATLIAYAWFLGSLREKK
jgi:hypothetical protein